MLKYVAIKSDTALYEKFCHYDEIQSLFFYSPGKDSGVVVTDDAREQLLEASAVTKKAFSSYRRDADPEEVYGVADGDKGSGDKGTEQGEMSPVILIMQPILRFLQLLCENHNRDLQVCVCLSHLHLFLSF